MKNDLQNLDSKRQFPLASTLAYDYENRLTQHATGMLGITVAHKYDGLGRLVRTDRTTAGPTTTQFEHVRDGLKLVGNIDATNTNTAPTWTNKPGALRPVESQQVVTNSATQYINVSDEISPARRTYNPSTSAAGDTEAIAAKGRLVLVNGSTPALAASLAVNPSELFSQRNMTYNENSIALPSDRGTLEVSGANLMYEGARVKSWMLGRDVNPAGRGDGAYYAQGAFSIGSVRPSPTTTPIGGWGNSVNNGCGGGCGITPPVGPEWSGDLPVIPPIVPGEFPQRPEKVSPKLPPDSKPRPMPDPVPPPSPPGGKDPDGKYQDCGIFLHTCKICEEPCTWEEWNDPLMHEKCCERLIRIATCDECVSDSLKSLLECYECKNAWDPCSNAPTSSCPSNPSENCLAYYALRRHVRFNQPSPRDLCLTCGDLSGDGSDTCAARIKRCIRACFFRHIFSPRLRGTCVMCCREEHMQCAEYVLNCGCNGHYY